MILLLVILGQFTMQTQSGTTSTVSGVRCLGGSLTCTTSNGRWLLWVDAGVGGGGAGLPADPTACPANQWVTDQNINGVLACAQPGFSQVSGTVTNAQLAGTYSGAGACGANTWASTLNGNAAPTCTQPSFGSLSGAATDSQIPNNITIDLATTATLATQANTLTATSPCASGQYMTQLDTSGNAICTQVATSQLSGTVTMAQLGTTNTSGNAQTFLRGDGVWAQDPPQTLTSVIAAKALANPLLPACNPVRRTNCRKGLTQ